MEQGLTDVLSSLHISAQKMAPDIQDNMKAIIQSFPPMVQITQTERAEVKVTAVLEIPASSQTEPWQVAAWQSIDGGEWHESMLTALSSDKQPNAMHSSHGSSHIFFETSVLAKQSLLFTLRFRHGENEPWRWTRDELGTADAHVIVNSPSTNRMADFSDVIHDLNPAWKVKSLTSQAPKTQLWSLTAEVPASTEDVSHFKHIPLGVPWGGFIR